MAITCSLGLLLVSNLTSGTVEPIEPFAIEVVDEATGRGVPLVELRTVNQIRFVTDSQGFIAVEDVDLLGRRVYFWIQSHGYEYPADGFGYRGKAIDLVPGGSIRLELSRKNIAERLYRVTGGGIYADSVRLGRPTPIREPLLNGLVFGQDSVMSVVHRGRILWFWGDTSRPSYPLGQFHISGATSELPSEGGLDPSIGVDLDYFVDETGFSRKLCEMPGDGPTWISGPALLRDEGGNERLYAGYVKIRNMLEAYQHGFVVWDDGQNRFEQVNIVAEGLPIYPNGHTVIHESDGLSYVYFTTPYPYTRVRATPEDYLDPTRYESFTPYREGTRDRDAEALDRDEHGKLVFSWRRNTRPWTPDDQAALIKGGSIQPREGILGLRDVETGKAVTAHAGTIAWNKHRERWIMIFCEVFGSSMLGETWYAEAPDLFGPWLDARKVVTHDRYSFYNPRHHPFFDQQDGRIIYFEGTYTHTFSGNSDQTPRYDYNQMMYRLNLDDVRLNLPQPIGRESRSNRNMKAGESRMRFRALTRASEKTIPIYEVEDTSGTIRLTASVPPSGDQEPLCYAYPPDLPPPFPALVPLHEFVSERDQDRIYSTDPSVTGYQKREPPVALVWPETSPSSPGTP